jgi:hypothetical protein
MYSYRGTSFILYYIILRKVSIMSEEQAAPEAIVEESSVENTEVTPEVQAPDEKELFTSRFTALSRKERQLQEEQKRIKEHEAKLNEINSIQESKDVMKALQYHGFTIDDVINHALGEDADVEDKDPVESLKEEFESYKQSLQEKEEQEKLQQEEINQKTIDEAITLHKDQINSYLSENLDKYEIITSQEQQDLVWDVTEAHFDEYGEVLSIEDAANKVEAHLEAEVQKLLNLKKFGSKSEPKGIEDKPTASRTLTSEQTPSVPVKERILSKEDSLKQAASLLKWN